jgi:integrase
LFPGDDPDEPLADFKRRWERIRRLSGLEDLTIHDLRRTVGTWLANLAGVPEHTIAALLNHKTRGAGVTAIYARTMDAPLRKAVKSLEKLLDSVDPRVEERKTANAR